MNQFVTLSAILLFVSLQAIAQTPASAPATPHDRLVNAAQRALLDDPDLKPWHLKLDVKVFDVNGSNPTAGTVEAWHSGKLYKTIYTFGESTRTSLHNIDGSYESHSGPETPALADAILDAFLDPGPSLQDFEGTSLDIRHQSFGKVTLDCIMLSRHMTDVDHAPMGLFPTYCLDQSGEELRASYNFGSQSLLRNDIGNFQGRDVSTHFSLVQGRVTVADAKVATLTTFTPTADFFLPGSSAAQFYSAYARVSGGIIAGMRLTFVQPIYPESAKRNRVSGTVVLHAVISRDGHIYSLFPVAGPDPDLTIAAIAAVRQWTYKPYLLNGSPTRVDTTITINFNLNR